MIPTTVSSSSTTGSNSPSSGNLNGNVSNSQLNQSGTSLVIGIAALILEGRAIAEDEYQLMQLPQNSSLQTQQQRPSAIDIGIPVIGGHHFGGRQSPKPSTSRAAAALSCSSNQMINITANSNYHAIHPLRNSDTMFSSAASLAADCTHQRWTQKLSQLRQASPAASLGYEQKVPLQAQSNVGDTELLALSINESGSDCCADFDIVRRVMVNQNSVVSPSAVSGNGSSSNISSSSGMGLGLGLGSSSILNSGSSASDNFLFSLQSLASTCLRTGNSSASVTDSVNYIPSGASRFFPHHRETTAHYQNHNYNQNQNQHQHQHSTTRDVFNMSGTGVKQSLKSARWEPITSHIKGGIMTTNNMPESCLGACGLSCSPKEQFVRPKAAQGSTMPIPLSPHRNHGSANPVSTSSPIVTQTTTTTTTPTATKVSTSTFPQQGPHCDQFLRKMGLAKGEAAEAEDHICDMSYVNITCSRWRAYCLKMEAILSRGESICIEVYLGPVGHKILLEQWIITQKARVSPPAMTMPSLCSAIRSQLYFSQISAWCDLIKKGDKSLHETGRVIFPTPTGAAGDLATGGGVSNCNSSNTTPGTSPSTAGTSPISQLTSMMIQCRPRLNIFYRIKQYDSTACFNSKPNIHNFPSVNVNENTSISVCLKSLPRINGGIPRISGAMQQQMNGDGNFNANLNTNNKNNLSSMITSKQIIHHKTKLIETKAKQKNITYNSELSDGGGPQGEKPNSNLMRRGNFYPTSAIRSRDDNIPISTLFTSFDESVMQSENGKSMDDDKDLPKSEHKCKFFIDEEEMLAYEIEHSKYDDKKASEFDGNSKVIIDDPEEGINAIDEGSIENLTHREKQLLKYRKRMQKRDKKFRKPDDKNEQDNNDQFEHQPMDQCDEDDQGYNGNQNEPNNDEGTSMPFKNSTTTKSYSGHIEMVSQGTQTPISSCEHCGNEQVLVCFVCESSWGQLFRQQKNTEINNKSKCTIEDGEHTDDDDDNYDDVGEIVDELEKSVSSLNSGDIISTPRNKAELLLQAIQRTPKAKKNLIVNQSKLKNNNHIGAINSIGEVGAIGNDDNLNGGSAGCQVCKRQKIAHNFIDQDAQETALDDGGDDEDDGKVSISNSAIDEGMPTEKCGHDDNYHSIKQTEMSDSVLENMEEETFNTSTTLTPNIERCTLSNCGQYTMIQIRIGTLDSPDSGNRTKNLSVEIGGQTANAPKDFQLFKTPTSPQMKPNLLQISQDATSPSGNSVTGGENITIRKQLPKVNLTPIFCGSTTTGLIASHSSPIPMTEASISDEAFSIDTTLGRSTNSITLMNDQSIGLNSDSNIPVQKSYSAPTLPNSPTPSPLLSPRFAKQAAIYKRRSRHLSDRSDRSSLGSDEQYSDEDLENGLLSPATSPLKNRLRVTTAFGRMPLLGNLEESLFHKRLMPKIEVVGFKLLLGASGGFCPTQLTIPAVAYLYELHGDTLSTPYMCEIRLPRKGYSIPRSGTIQATLLNPIGTVVRMFVIPYDMRDMPPLHQTFIRQRILAESTSPTNGVGNTHDEDTASVSELSLSTAISNATLTPNHKKHEFNCNGNEFNNGPQSDGSVSQERIVDTCQEDGDNQSPRLSTNMESSLGHFISVEHMKRLRYSIHLRFQTSRSGRLSLHTDIRLLISRRTDCDTAAAHAKGVLEAPNDLITYTVMPTNPKYSARQDGNSSIGKI